MEPFWSPVVATVGNQWQIGPRRERLNAKEVLRRAEETFGAEAVDDARSRVAARKRRTDPKALCDRPVLIKRALEYAIAHAEQRGRPSVGHVDALLGLIRDAEDPIGTGMSHRGRAALDRLGLRNNGPHPVRLIIEAADRSLDNVRATLLAVDE